MGLIVLETSKAKEEFRFEAKTDSKKASREQ